MNIRTHNGKFHADELFAIATVDLATGTRNDVFRSRDDTQDEDFDLVLDTGGKYDRVKYFDHHQQGFVEKYENGVSLSAFGLIWREYGATAVLRVSTRMGADLTPEQLESVLWRCRPLVIALDARDNGELGKTSYFSLNPDVRLEMPSLAEVIGLFNPVPLLCEGKPEAALEAMVHDCFDRARTLTFQVLENTIMFKISRLLGEVYARSLLTDSPILVLDRFVEWLAVAKDAPALRFVVHPNLNGDAFVTSAVPQAKDYADYRCRFPGNWAGRTGPDLAAVSGVPTAVFCHKGLHLATASTQAGAIALAELALLEGKFP